ncbi:MAG TPA: hypothetical protein VE961_06465, partial [Pyrinomonadaceae bacterium]|nr:hypothetical protein [Pyrinomonadaceae bacterium]
TKGFTFVKEDLNDAAAYNRVLWEGTMARPYPNTRSGLDLRQNRARLLKAAGIDPAPQKADGRASRSGSVKKAVRIHHRLD